MSKGTVSDVVAGVIKTETCFLYDEFYSSRYKIFTESIWQFILVLVQPNVTHQSFVIRAGE